MSMVEVVMTGEGVGGGVGVGEVGSDGSEGREGGGFVGASSSKVVIHEQ